MGLSYHLNDNGFKITFVCNCRCLKISSEEGVVVFRMSSLCFYVYVAYFQKPMLYLKDILKSEGFWWPLV